MKVHPIPYAIFETIRPGYSNFVSLFSVMKDNSSEFFQHKPYMLWTKKAHHSEIFRLLSGSVKIHQIPHVIFETKCQFFFKLCSNLEPHEK